MAHLWAKWLRHPCRLRDPHRCRAGGKIRSGPLVGKVATSPLPSRGPCFRAGGKIRSGPLVGKVATSPLPSRGSPPLQSGGQNQKWPTYGQSGYVTPAVSGIPTASEQGGGSEVAHLWAKRLHHPCRLGDPHGFRAGGAKSEVAHLWAKWLCHPCRLGDPHRCRAGGEIRSGPLVGKVATSPLPSRGLCFRAGGKIRSGPLVGKVATSPLPSRGSAPLHSGGQNQKWPTCGQSGYVTPAVSGIPTAAQRGAKSEVAHLWAKWLRHPCRLGDPHRFRAGGGIRSGPLMGKVATSPLPSRGSPPLQSRAKSAVAHLWAKWLRHPCRLGDPHRCTAGGKIRSGPLMGKVATSPLPSRGSPPMQSGGGKSEVAHLWAKWLHHPCRLGDPHRCRAGGEIRSGPLVGKVATSPLPSRGSPRLQSVGGKIRSGPLVGKVATSPLPSWGSPPRAELGGGGGSEVAHLWAKWLRHPCRLGDPHRFRAGGGGSKVAHLWAKWLRHPCRLGNPNRCIAGGEIRSGPLVGKVGTSPLPSWGSPPLQSGGEIRSASPLPSRGSPPLHSGGGNQKWPTCGQSGYFTPAVSGIPTAAERGGKSEVAHLWAKWLRHPCRPGDPHRCRAGGKSEVAHLWAKWLRQPCRLGDPHCCRAGGEIRSGPLVGKVATSPLPSRGSPPMQSGGQNQKWPTYGQSGYVTPAVSGIPNASKRGAKSEVAHLWAKWLRHPCRLGDPDRCIAGGEIRSGPLVGKVATSPLPSRGSPPLQSGGGGIKSGPLVGKVATSPLPSRGSPPLQSGGQNQKWPTCGQSGYVTPAVPGIPTAAERGGNQKWPTCGQSGYVTPAVSGIPTAAERGGKSEVAHLWAKWLRHPCRLGDPHRCRAGGKIRSGPTYGQSGYVTPAVSGIPSASKRGAKSEVAHLWAKWLRHPCRLGDPHRCIAGGEIRSGPLMDKVATSPLPSRGSPPLQSGGGGIKSGPLVGKVATSPLPSRGSPPLQSGGQNQKWPTCGQSGYVTPAVPGIPTASERGRKSEVAHLWAKWLRHPCRLRDPHRFRAGGLRDPQIQSGGGNQKWPTYGQSGYVTPAVSGIPTASKQGGKSEVAHLWAKWLRHSCRLGDPHRCIAGGEIRSGPLVGKVATSPLPSRGSPPLQSGGGGIKSGPLVGKVATSPLPSRGSPPLQSGGQNQKWPTCGQSGYVTPAVPGIPTAAERGGNQKWPTCGQSGYVTPAVSGIPTAAERGGKSEVTYGQSGYVTPAVSGIPTASERGRKSEVAHLWAKWLRHPCRLRDPRRFRAGGKIRSGPLMGKVATSPLPSRGSQPLQSGGQNQKWPTYGQSGYVTPAVSGIPSASKRGAKSEVAHLWAKWLRHPCRLRDPHRFRAGGKIRSGPLMGKVATSPLPSQGSPPLQSGGGNQKWPTCGQSGYVTPAVSGIPTAA